MKQYVLVCNELGAALISKLFAGNIELLEVVGLENRSLCHNANFLCTPVAEPVEENVNAQETAVI